MVVYLLLFLISDSPQVSLRLGRTLDADNIRTGHDVYFECDVKANPSPLRLEWLHNVNTEKILPILLFNHSGLKSLEKRAKIMLFAHQTKGKNQWSLKNILQFASHHLLDHVIFFQKPFILSHSWVYLNRFLKKLPKSTL